MQWILARSQYRFGTFDFSALPKGKREQALQLELSQWSPYVESGYYIGWHEGTALVWSWDRNKVSRAMEAQHLKVKRPRILPETLLQAPQEEGLRLWQCAEGFEGQVWHAGHLQHSRWWPKMPDEETWLAFQRNASIQPEAQRLEVPVPQNAPLAGRPWLSADRSGGGHSQQQTEQLALAAVFLLLALPALWYGFALYQLTQASAERQNQLAQLRRTVQPLQQARGEALDALGRIQALKSLAPYPDQLFLMAKVAEAFPANGTYVKEWNFQNGLLKITVTAPGEISSSFLVNALQLAGPFRDVKALPGQDAKTAILQMQVNAS